jgi:branched-chain amino acid transport system substrate-binding protein
VKFTYDDGVWAVLSSVDSNHNHVLSRVSLKTEIPVVNAGSTDPTLTEHAMPWLVRCMADDRQNAAELLNYLFRVKKYDHVAVLRVNDRDGRVGVMEFNKGAKRLGHPVLMELRFLPGDEDFRAQLRLLATLPAKAIVIWANPPEGAKIVRQMRELGMKQPLLGGDGWDSSKLYEIAQGALDGSYFSNHYTAENPAPVIQDFVKKYKAKYNRVPETFSVLYYDAAMMVAKAMEMGKSADPKSVRDNLKKIKSFAGVSGIDYTFNEKGEAVNEIFIVKIQKGTPVMVSKIEG